MASRKPDDREQKLQRKRDPYLDRRSGEDRRQVYSVDYFLKNNPDRRSGRERRSRIERRKGCIRVDEWASVCPDIEEITDDKPYVIDSLKR
ncbi:hypothetical protein [Desulfopila inferna]|uniref:hypothetical protein n=1 Tax=Desulfopila inferna TaxID=468528 RepID=UPI0019654164|nr:hypothetical protein [Desulfopila inferna]MBM9605692.1 hypothetical protein [Desulfopila inferna]